MRGQRSSVAGKKIDIVLVAARYNADGRLHLAQGYARRGVVWGDLRLYDREQLMGELQSGKQLVTGRPAELAGDFQILDRIELHTPNGPEGLLAIQGKTASQDDLGLPLF